MISLRLFFVNTIEVFGLGLLLVVSCAYQTAPSRPIDETIITGIIVDTLGNPVADAVVKKFSADYIPVNNEYSFCETETTSIDGHFSMYDRTPGIFNLFVQHAQSGREVLIRDVSVASELPVKIGPDTLRSTGSLSVNFDYSPGNGYIYITGTPFVKTINIETTRAITFDSLPSGLLPLIRFAPKKNLEITSRLADSVIILSDAQTSLSDINRLFHRIYFNTTDSGADVNDTIYNFPTVIRLDSSNFDFGSVLQKNLKLTKADGTTIPYDVEQWDTINKVAVLWFKADTVMGNSDTQFIDLYRDMSYSYSGTEVLKIFDTANGYAGVWHLGNANKPFYDATSNHNNGIDSVSDGITEGIIGNSQGFDGIDDFIGFSDTKSLQLKRFTVSFWMKATDFQNIVILFDWGKAHGNELSHNNGWLLAYDAQDARLEVQGAGDTTFRSFVHTQLPPEWCHIVATYDSSVSSLYFNGYQYTTDTMNVSIMNDTNFIRKIGSPQLSLPGFSFNGAMDEIELSRKAMSKSYIKLLYENQRQASQFLMFR